MNISRSVVLLCTRRASRGRYSEKRPATHCQRGRRRSPKAASEDGGEHRRSAIRSSSSEYRDTTFQWIPAGERLGRAISQRLHLATPHIGRSCETSRCTLELGPKERPVSQKAKEGEQEVGAAVGGRAGRPQEGSVVSSWALSFPRLTVRWAWVRSWTWNHAGVVSSQ